MIFDMVNGALDAARYSSLNSIADETDRIESRVAVEAFANCPDFKVDNTRMKAVPAQQVLDMLNRHAGIAVAMEGAMAPEDERHHLRKVFEAVNEKHARIGGSINHDDFHYLEADLKAMESEMGELQAMADGTDIDSVDFFSNPEAALESVESFFSGQRKPSSNFGGFFG